MFKHTVSNQVGHALVSGSQHRPAVRVQGGRPESLPHRDKHVSVKFRRTITVTCHRTFELAPSLLDLTKSALSLSYLMPSSSTGQACKQSQRVFSSFLGDRALFWRPQRSFHACGSDPKTYCRKKQATGTAPLMDQSMQRPGRSPRVTAESGSVCVS